MAAPALQRFYENLRRLRRRLTQPKRTVDVFGALFARSIGPELIGLATGESLAHLNCLRSRGYAIAEPDAEGVLWWRGLAPAPAGERPDPLAAGANLQSSDAAPCDAE